MIAKDILITSIEQTCFACPSQWEIELEDGRCIYARNRHGVLTAEISREPSEDIQDALNGPIILNENTTSDDGVSDYEVTQDELLEKLARIGFVQEQKNDV